MDIDEALAAWLDSVAPWQSAPKWANYRAMDGSGDIYWYACKPHYIEANDWFEPSAGRVKLAYCPERSNAEHTLSERPNIQRN